MKIVGRAVSGFLRKPDPGLAAILVFGPDAGLVEERAETLVKTAVADPRDPFRVLWLDSATLLDDPARLADGTKAQSLTAGQMVMRVRGATDGLAKLFDDYFEWSAKARKPGDALVVLEAGDLPARSPLRRLFQDAPNGAAIACYADEGDTLDSVIVSTLGAHGLKAAPDALAYLADSLGGDRRATRSELEKLALYMGTGGTVKLEDAEAAVGDSAQASLDDVVYAAADGAALDLDRALDRAFAEGNNPVTIIRAAQRHFSRLHLAAGAVAEGRSSADAVAALKPPVIFKLADRFRAELGAWSPTAIATALTSLLDAEAECKSSGRPAELLCRRVFAEIVSRARSAARGRR